MHIDAPTPRCTAVYSTHARTHAPSRGADAAGPQAQTRAPQDPKSRPPAVPPHLISPWIPPIRISIRFYPPLGFPLIFYLIFPRNYIHIPASKFHACPINAYRPPNLKTLPTLLPVSERPLFSQHIPPHSRLHSTALHRRTLRPVLYYAPPEPKTPSTYLHIYGTRPRLPSAPLYNSMYSITCATRPHAMVQPPLPFLRI